MIINGRRITITSSPVSSTIPVLRSQEVSSKPSDVFQGVTAAGQYIIDGTHTLAGAVSLNPGSDAIDKTRIEFIYQALLTTDTANGKSFSIFGFTFSDEQALKNANVVCIYNGSTWHVDYYPNFNETGIIPETAFTDESIPERAFKDDSIPETAFKDGTIGEAELKAQSVTETKIAEQAVVRDKIRDSAINTSKIADQVVTNAKLFPTTAGSVKVGNAENVWEDVNMNDPDPVNGGSFLIGQGYGLPPGVKVIFNDITIDKDGRATIVYGAINAAKIATYAVTADKADDTMASDVIPVEIDIADTSDNHVYMGFKGRVVALYATVKTTIVGDGDITANSDDDLAMNDGVISISNGTLKNQSYAVAPSSNHAFEKGDILKFKVTGSTAGKVRLSVIVVKLP